MTLNNNTSVLPFYRNINEQNHRKSYAYGAIYPLFAPADRLLPFQIMRATRTNGITSVKLYDKTGAEVADITQKMQETGLQIVRFESRGYDVIVYPAILPMPINQFDGIYYLTITDGVDTWYSEMFTAVQDVSCYLKIEWYDVENLMFDAGTIVYQNPTFRNVLYLNTELGKPEYGFTDEGEDRDGYFFPIKQISEKTYKCVILAPEYLCDVMRFIRMADIVKVTDRYGRVYDCDTFLITPTWQTQGNLASVEIEFQTDTVVKKIGRGYIDRFGGDFNEDFNADFSNAKSIGTITGEIIVTPYGGSAGSSVVVRLSQPAQSELTVTIQISTPGTVDATVEMGQTESVGFSILPGVSVVGYTLTQGENDKNTYVLTIINN